jgi:hypothetical protein
MVEDPVPVVIENLQVEEDRNSSSKSYAHSVKKSSAIGIACFYF